ncbi:MAG: hypothetical protein IT332_04030 [Ardenticatenales bacterium]|nr:hypothetical protein [Ardenticatenales bacterium]
MLTKPSAAPLAARTAWLIGLATLALAASALILRPPTAAGAPPRGRLALDAPSGAAAPAQGTLTATAVATGTATITPTVGATLTLTAMPTGSATSDDTVTPAPTGSATSDDTATPMPTGSATSDDTATPMPTGSATPDDTMTPAPTSSATTVGTGTAIATGSATAISTGTAVATGSATAIGTGTVVATGSATSVATGTAIATGTGTAGATPSGTVTAAPTVSANLALPLASLRRWHEAGNVATGIQVQNLDPDSAANIVAQFFDDSGAIVASVPRTAAGGGAPNFYLPTVFRDLALASGIFSVRVTGNQPLGAIVRTDWFSVRGAGIAANPATGPDVIVASFLRRSHGRSSMVAVQNTTSTTATATIVAYGGAGGNMPRATFQLTLPPHAARRIWADFEAAFTALGTFEGWLRVTGTQTLSVQAWEVGEIAGGAPLAVAAFEGQPAATAGNRLAVALFRSAQKGVLGADRLNTRIVVVNPGLIPAVVTVSYAGTANETASMACRGGSFAHPAVTLPPGGRHVFRQAPGGGHSIPADCFGTARIRTGAPAQRVVAMVYDATNDDELLSAYVALPEADAAQLVALPLFRRRHVGLTTGIQVMNIATTTATVRIAFSATDAGTGVSTPIGGCTVCQQAIAPNDSYTWWPPSIGGIPDGTFGAAVITSNQPIIALVNDYPTSPDAAARTDPATYLGLSVQ